MDMDPDSLSGPRYRMRKPSIVSEIIDRGGYGFLGLLLDSPSQVLKFCIPEKKPAIFSLEREKRILEILGDHQYIIKLLWASERGLCFDYYPLRSIRRYYESQNGTLPSLEKRYKWCHQSVVGISYIHSKNIIHNDLSARNILLSSNLDIKICDFGSATFVGEKIHAFGEFRYVGFRSPPEQVATFKDDIFSIGGLFYEIISGKPPYAELDRSEAVRRYNNNIFASLDGFDPDYAAIIDNCWNRRYSSIQALEQDLLHLFNT
jgi:serine/threonine protein kinase